MNIKRHIKKIIIITSIIAATIAAFQGYKTIKNRMLLKKIKTQTILMEEVGTYPSFLGEITILKKDIENFEKKNVKTLKDILNKKIMEINKLPIYTANRDLKNIIKVLELFYRPEEEAIIINLDSLELKYYQIGRKYKIDIAILIENIKELKKELYTTKLDLIKIILSNIETSLNKLDFSKKEDQEIIGIYIKFLKDHIRTLKEKKGAYKFYGINTESYIKACEKTLGILLTKPVKKAL